MSGSESNIKIEPVDLYWENPETTSVPCLPGASLDGLHFNLWSAEDAVAYYCWFNLDAGSADPAPAGKTAIEVDVITGDTAAQVAVKLQAVLDAEDDFNAAVDSRDATKVVFETVGYGETTQSVDVDTTMVLAQCLAGSVFSVGYTDGDIEVALSEDLFDVVAHQSGTTVLDKIRTGINLEPISVVMKESDAAKIQVLLGEGSGANYTPSGGDEVTGLGSSKKFTNISSQGRRLVLHPVRNLSTDLSGDYAFWRAYPTISSILFSGEADHKVTVEFQILPNPLIREDLEFFNKGDHTQNLLR